MFSALWSSIDVAHLDGSLCAALATRNYPSNSKILKGLYTRKMYGPNESLRRRTTLVLETINRRLSQGTGGYTVLDSMPTIEHVMPQTVSSEWIADLGVMWEQVHQEYLHTLGNLTLVTAEWNSGLSNAPFTEKTKQLSQNSLRLNSSYFSPKLTRWGRVEIRERAESLGGVILETWPSFLPADVGDESGDNALIKDAYLEFHFESLERVARHLNVPFHRRSQSRYESVDGKHRLVGLCSKVHSRRDAK
ncbi:MAG: HNH endonuclease family protein [Planctomycetales bacterium]